LIFCLFDIPETPRTVGLSNHNGMITGAYTVFESLNTKNSIYFETFYRAMDDRKLLSPLYSGLRNTIPPHRFLGTKTPQPPMDEQKSIVRYLSHANGRWERTIRAKKRELELVSELLLKETQHALELPGKRSLRLSTVAEVMSRPIDRRAGQSYIPVGLYNRGRGIFHKEKTDGRNLGDSEFFLIKDGDLLISGQFAWEGAVALARTKESDCVASHRYPILRGRPEYASSSVLLALLRSSLGLMLLDHNSRGAAGRNRPLNIRMFLKEKIPIPPLSSQARITELLDQEYALAQSLAQMIRFINEYRVRLSSDVVTGKLDVRQVAEKLPDDPESKNSEETTDLSEEIENSGEEVAA